VNARPLILRSLHVDCLNDVHSGLNHCQPLDLVHPHSEWELARAVVEARDSRVPIIASGSRHAMGGQQFCNGGVVLDCRKLNKVLSFDPAAGIVEVEAGIEWPELVDFLQPTRWSIVQKQTGADHLTVGGAIAANIHGRGLAFRPLIQDIEDLTIVNAAGELIPCSRTENAELFRHAVGGYGMFGIVYSARLRLAPRLILRRVVRHTRADELVASFQQLIAAGFLYGDWQFAIDDTSDEFLDLGILSAYEPAGAGLQPNARKTLTAESWRRLLLLAHTDKSHAFQEYSRHYLATDGQLYSSDTHQLSPYLDGYHEAIDSATGAKACGSEMITELFVPRTALATFLSHARQHLRQCRANVIYGTVRLIEREDETVLAWARESWACIIFNLHVDHEPYSIARAQDAFRGLIDCALGAGGSYYLTYHRWATRAQLLKAHPAIQSVFTAKRRLDPSGLFQSDWYRHHNRLIA
jgi:FAD/FMN-containing dehydrogenase